MYITKQNEIITIPIDLVHIDVLIVNVIHGGIKNRFLNNDSGLYLKKSVT